jgi:hypothetical protein
MVERTAQTHMTMKVGLVILAGVAALLATLALNTGTAHALDIREFKAGPSFTQAGGHPDVTVEYAGETRYNPDIPEHCKCNDPRDVIVSLPTGFIGNPHATPQCKAADFARNTCPADSQIGTLGALVAIAPQFAFNFTGEPLYNLVPRSNQAGLLGATFLPGFINTAFYIQLAARTDGDYGLDSGALGIERQFSVETFTVKLWGVPASESHDEERCGSTEFCNPTVKSNSPKVPFLVNAGVCSSNLSSKVTVVGYDNSVNSATAPWPTPTGCDQLTFNPSQSARPTTTAADSASGVDVNLTVPQLFSPEFPSPSEIKSATLKLPAGFSLNPNAADGKLSCSDQQANFGTREEAACPEFSKVGVDTLVSPALPAPISGGIYLGDPLPGNRYRIFLTADGFGTHVKLLGTASLDLQTGQVTTRFENLPQSPLTEFNLHFFGAERGILATPTQCGTYAVDSTFVPWDDVLATQSATQFFEIETGPDGAPCPPETRDFHPTFSAASTGNGAGTFSPFTVNLTRNDGDQNLSGLTIATPPGFTASLAGVPYCSDAALAAVASASYAGSSELQSPICPASAIGSVTASGGAGSRPVYLPGTVYLAGPYKGAPLSLAIVTPAVSGPYDLGNVVVRTALKVDPLTAQVTAVNDPLPQIFEGIPLRLRSIQIRLDRTHFALNPTNCSPFNVAGAITGDQGTTVSLASHYQVANCRLLPYKPALSLKLTGGLNRRGHPALHATLRSQAGEANSKEISVSMPPNELLDNSHIGTVCTRVDFAADACPDPSLVGNAKIISPILDQPLTGNVYLRSSAHRLPDLALKLKGQVEIENLARIDSVNGGLRATFFTVPDVPFSTIQLNLVGGKKGLLQNTESLCGAPQNATTKMTGQNGAVTNTKTKLQVSCKKSQKRRAKGGSR